MTQPTRPSDINALLVWIAGGALFLALLYLILFYPGIARGELGVVEMTQNTFLAVALVIMLDLVRRADTTYLRAWMVLVSLGTFLLLGEETSWGQHFFGWEAGGVFTHINDQGETNFHNTSHWLDQRPRDILTFGMVLGTIVHPLVKLARKGKGLFDNPWWLAPTLASLPPVIYSMLAYAPKHIEDADIIPYSLDLFRWSEFQEVFLYMFFVTYALSLHLRLRANQRAA
jgi:hypothetical protein